MCVEVNSNRAVSHVESVLQVGELNLCQILFGEVSVHGLGDTLRFTTDIDGLRFLLVGEPHVLHVLVARACRLQIREGAVGSRSKDNLRPPKLTSIVVFACKLAALRAAVLACGIASQLIAL